MTENAVVVDRAGPDSADFVRDDFVPESGREGTFATVLRETAEQGSTTNPQPDRPIPTRVF